jgi:2-iminobutanoate/2-iminopropanoate deaminase
MTRHSVHSDAAPAAIGPYSQAVVVDGWVYTSGQIALDPATGALVPGDIEAQTTRVLENLRAVLFAADCGFHEVVKTTVYLADMRDFARMNAIYERFFGDAKPARSTVQAAGLPRGAAVEIDVVARQQS